jgi:hypothetical protein
MYAQEYAMIAPSGDLSYLYAMAMYQRGVMEGFTAMSLKTGYDPEKMDNHLRLKRQRAEIPWTLRSLSKQIAKECFDQRPEVVYSMLPMYLNRSPLPTQDEVSYLFPFVFYSIGRMMGKYSSRKEQTKNAGGSKRIGDDVPPRPLPPKPEPKKPKRKDWRESRFAPCCDEYGVPDWGLAQEEFHGCCQCTDEVEADLKNIRLNMLAEEVRYDENLDQQQKVLIERYLRRLTGCCGTSLKWIMSAMFIFMLGITIFTANYLDVVPWTILLITVPFGIAGVAMWIYECYWSCSTWTLESECAEARASRSR